MILVFSSLKIIVVYEFRSQLVLCSIVSRLKTFEQIIKNAKVSAASDLSKKKFNLKTSSKFGSSIDNCGPLQFCGTYVWGGKDVYA